MQNDKTTIAECIERLNRNSDLDEEIRDWRGSLNAHMLLLHDAGLIAAERFETQAGEKVILFERITLDGYDFLDLVRDNAVWKEVKERLKAAGGSASLPIIKAVAESVIKSMLQLA
jgi:methyl coenzyme M reductase beta subunit